MKNARKQSEGCVLEILDAGAVTAAAMAEGLSAAEAEACFAAVLRECLDAGRWQVDQDMLASVVDAEKAARFVKAMDRATVRPLAYIM